MRIRTTDCCSTQKGSGFAMTQEQSKQTECQTLIFCVQDFLARHSLSPESGEDLQMPEELCSSRLPDWFQTSDLRISSLKMFPDCFRMTKAGRFTPSSVRYLSLGYGVEWKVLNSKDFGVPQSRKRVYLVGYLDRRCAGKILPFPTENGTPLIQIRTGSQGKRVYSPQGLVCTLTSLAGGMGGKTGLYEMGVPIKENTKQGYKMAYPGDSIDLGYAGMNTRRGSVGHQIAHTLTTGIQQGRLHFVDLSPPPLITAHCRCLNTRQSGIHNHKGECSGVLKEEGARAVLTPGREETRQNGRRMEEPEEPMFTITATDRHGVAYRGRIRKLVPRECLRLQGFYDWQIDCIEQDTSDSQLYKQAGNGVTVNVIEAIGTLLRQADAEIRAEDEKTKR